MLVGALAAASQLFAGLALAQATPEDPRQVIDRGQSDLRALEDERTRRLAGLPEARA